MESLGRGARLAARARPGRQPVRRALACPRPLDDVRSRPPVAARPTGAGTRPWRRRPRRCWARSRMPRRWSSQAACRPGPASASGVLGQGEALALPTTGYYSLEGFSAGILERFGVEVRRYDARDASDFRAACDGAALAVMATPFQPAAHPHGHRAGRPRRARGRGAALLRQHVRDAAPAAPARPRRRPRLAERDEVPRGAFRRARRRRRDARLRRCATRIDSLTRRIDRRACSRPIPRGSSCAACARCTCASRARSRPRPSSRAGSRRIPAVRAVHYPGLAEPPGLRARAAPDARRGGRRAGLRARRRSRRPAAARRPCGSCAARRASAASRR